jgi:hypothetical protein
MAQWRRVWKRWAGKWLRREGKKGDDGARKLWCGWWS